VGRRAGHAPPLHLLCGGLDQGRADRQTALELRHVGAELAFLAVHALLQLGKLPLAALELILANLEIDADANLAGLELVLALPELLEAVARGLLALGEPFLAVLHPAGLLGEGFRTRELAFSFGQLTLPLGQEPLLLAQAVAPIRGEALTLGELSLGLDQLARPLTELAGALREGERPLLERGERAAQGAVQPLLHGAELRDALLALAQILFECVQPLELQFQLVRAEGQLGAAIVELRGTSLEVPLQGMTKPLTKPHAICIGTVREGEKPPSGGQHPRLCALCYDVMRLRFLVSGLAFFALLLTLAALPVVAQGGSSPSCTVTGTAQGDLLMGTANADVICGRGGSDVITARGGNDIVRGGGGADTIYGDTGQDQLYGGRGTDDIYARDSQRDHLYGGPGSDYGRVDNPLDVLRSIEST
jgi:hypothetical protein